MSSNVTAPQTVTVESATATATQTNINQMFAPNGHLVNYSSLTDIRITAYYLVRHNSRSWETDGYVISHSDHVTLWGTGTISNPGWALLALGTVTPRLRRSGERRDGKEKFKLIDIVEILMHWPASRRRPRSRAALSVKMR